MKDVKIMNCFIEENDGGMACGPVPGFTVVEAKVQDKDGKEVFFSVADVMGMPHFYITDKSTIDDQVQMTEDEEFINYLQKSFHCSAEEYEEILERKNDPWYQMYRYLMYLARDAREEYPSNTAGKFIRQSIGKWLSELDIPATEDEKEWLEEQAEDEE